MCGDRRDQEGIQRPPESSRLPCFQRQRVGLMVTCGKERTSASFPLSYSGKHPLWSPRHALVTFPSSDGEGSVSGGSSCICLERDQASAPRRSLPKRVRSLREVAWTKGNGRGSRGPTEGSWVQFSWRNPCGIIGCRQLCDVLVPQSGGGQKK